MTRKRLVADVHTAQRLMKAWLGRVGGDLSDLSLKGLARSMAGHPDCPVELRAFGGAIDRHELLDSVLGTLKGAQPPKRISSDIGKGAKEKIPEVGLDGFLRSFAWRRLRYQALVVCGGRCQCCGRTPREHSVILNVDHIKPRRTHPELALEMGNLQVLCDDRNHGKGNWDQTDWRASPL